MEPSPNPQPHCLLRLLVGGSLAGTMLASITPTAARAGSLAAVPRLSIPQRQQAATTSQSRVATQKQALSGRNGISQRRARAAAARRLTAATVAKAGGDVLVVGSSGQTAARVVVSLLRTGFKVTAGAGEQGAQGPLAAWHAAVQQDSTLPISADPSSTIDSQVLGTCTYCNWLYHMLSSPRSFAGVDTDLEESQEVVKFAKQIEILNKGEAGNLKARGPALLLQPCGGSVYGSGWSCTAAPTPMLHSG